MYSYEFLSFSSSKMHYFRCIITYLINFIFYSFISDVKFNHSHLNITISIIKVSIPHEIELELWYHLLREFRKLEANTRLMFHDQKIRRQHISFQNLKLLRIWFTSLTNPIFYLFIGDTELNHSYLNLTTHTPKYLGGFNFIFG